MKKLGLANTYTAYIMICFKLLLITKVVCRYLPPFPRIYSLTQNFEPLGRMLFSSKLFGTSWHFCRLMHFFRFYFRLLFVSYYLNSDSCCFCLELRCRLELRDLSQHSNSFENPCYALWGLWILGSTWGNFERFHSVELRKWIEMLSQVTREFCAYPASQRFFQNRQLPRFHLKTSWCQRQTCCIHQSGFVAHLATTLGCRSFESSFDLLTTICKCQSFDHRRPAMNCQDSERDFQYAHHV